MNIDMILNVRAALLGVENKSRSYLMLIVRCCVLLKFNLHSANSLNLIFV